MPDYCGTADCINLFEDFSAVASGTVATNLITEASGWLTAEINNFHDGVIPTSGTTYSYYITRAAALETIYLAIDRRKADQYEDVEPWWQKYHDRSMEIIDRLRDGEITLAADTSPWERGIGPAEPIANGTVSAPTEGMCESNWAIADQWYTGDTMPRTFVIEIDGTGSRIEQQTYKWRYEYGSQWEDEEVGLDWGWNQLAYGVYIRFVDIDEFEPEQRWEIDCQPRNRRANKANSMRTYYMSRG